MADKQTIVIKKITINAAGAHGGSWKVAFADFMTALMAFFLVMWLISAEEAIKKQVSDYFSTPSIIEYNFSNYGVELTLEKLFLDLINEPLKAFQAFMSPADKTPNLLSAGVKRIVLSHIIDELGSLAKNVVVDRSSFEIDIIDNNLFLPGTAKPSPDYISNVAKIKEITTGLEDATVQVGSYLFEQSVPDNSKHTATQIATARERLLVGDLRGAFEHNSVDIKGEVIVTQAQSVKPGTHPPGFIRFTIKQKEVLSDGKKPRPLEDLFGSGSDELNVYDNFVRKLTDRKSRNTPQTE